MAEFNTVWKILQTLDRVMGNYVMVDADQKLTILQRIYQWIWLICICCPMLLTISTIVVNFSDLSLVLQSVIVFLLYASAIVTNLDILRYKNNMIKVLHWCKETQALDNVHMNRARIFLVKVVKRLAFFFSFAFFSITILLIIIGQLLPENIYSKYRPPQPFELPVQDRDNWKVYIITCVMQTVGCFYGNVFPCLYYSFFTIFCVTFYAHLNIIFDDIENVCQLRLSTKVNGCFNHGDDGKMFKNKMNGIAKKYCEGLE